MQSKVVKLRFY